MPKDKNFSGVIDIITVIGTLFLIISLAVGSYVVYGKRYNFNIFEKAMVDRSYDQTTKKAQTNNNNSLTRNNDRNKENEDDNEEEDKTLRSNTQNNLPATKNSSQNKCDANGVMHDDGSVVIGGSASSGYSKCQNGRWEPCETCKITDLTTVPYYLEDEYLRATRGLTYGQQVREITSTSQLESLECTNSGGQWINYNCVYPTIGERRCSGNTIESYSGGSWTTAENCEGGCADGKCISDIRQDVSIEKTDNGFERSVTTLTRDDQDNIIPSLTTTIPLDIKTDTNFEKVDDGFIRNFTTIVKNANTNEILSYLSQRITPTPQSQVDLPECGKPGLTQEQRDQCTNIARVSAYNNPITGRYIQSFSNPNNIFQWQQLGYSSSEEAIQDCVDKNGVNSAYSCMKQMTGYGAEQVASSVQLGATGTAIGALTVATGGLATGAISLPNAIALGMATSTMYQTGSAVDICIISPNSPECRNAKFWAGVSWLNIGSSWVANTYQASKVAQSINTAVNLANIGFDYVDIKQSCGDGQFASGFGCVAAWGGLIFDVGQGGVDAIRAIDNNLSGLSGTFGSLPDANSSIIPDTNRFFADSNVGYNTNNWNPNTTISVQQELLDPIKELYSPQVLIRQGNNATVFDSPSEASDFYRNLTGQEPPPGTISTNTLAQISSEAEIQNILSQASRNQTAEDMLFAPAQRPVIPETGGGSNVNNWANGLANWWQQTVGDLNFRGLENEELTVPNRNQADNIVQNLPDDFQAGPRVFNANGDNLPSATEINIPRPIVNAIENYVYSRTGGVLPFINNIIAPNRTVDLNYTPPTPLTTRIGDWIDRTVGNNPVINRLIGRPEDSNLRPNEVTLDSVDKPARLPSENLAKGIVGIEIGDTAMTPRLLDDHYSLKQKYGLPDRGLRFENPNEYIVQLNRIAKENGIPIRDASEWESFFQRHLAGAVFDDTGKQVFVDFRIAINDPITYGGLLEHELIHALQDKRYPGMSVEVMEYEAYITANMSLTNVQNDPRNIQETLFNNIEFSINHWYEEKNLPNPWLDNKSNINTSPTTGFLPAVREFGVNVRNRNSTFTTLGLVSGGIAGIIYLDEQFDWGLTDIPYNIVISRLNNLATLYALNNNKELSEILINNPNQRPYDEIIQEAIDNYEMNNPDSDVYYESNPQALSLVDIFKQVFSKSSLDLIYQVFTDEEYKELSFTQKIIELPKMHGLNGNSVIESALVAAANTRLFAKQGGTYPIEGFDDDTRELISLIESEVQNTGNPVSQSFVIEYFLDKNKGDLTQAIFDSSNFQEYIFRGWGREMVDNPYLWVRDHVLDEYSPLLPYQVLPAEEGKLENSEIYYDYSLQNRLGEVYHSANITALLNYLPPNVIKVMVIGEYMVYGEKHGLIKLSADLEVLKELDDVNDLLESYEQPTN